MKSTKTIVTSAGLFVAAFFSQLGGASASEPIIINDLVVTLIDSVNVPAQHTGMVAELRVREGDNVQAKQTLGRLDDRRARLEEERAKTQREIAVSQADDALAQALAEKKLAHQKQLKSQHGIQLEAAAKKANNQTRIQASEKAQEVAKNELERATTARARYRDSVSQSEIDGLRLAYDRSRLETVQATFELEIDALDHQAESKAAMAHQLNVEQSEIELAQVHADEKIERLQSDLQDQQWRLARLAAEQHTIASPMVGVVVERFCNVGDWVKAGDPIFRIIRLDRLRAEGYIDAARLDVLTKGKLVNISVDLPGDNAGNITGKVVFVSPEIDPVNNEVRFWVEFDNPDHVVLPGMQIQASLEQP